MAKKKTPPRIENIDLRRYVQWETDTHDTGSGYNIYTHVDAVKLTHANLERLARDLTSTDLEAYGVERVLTHYELYSDKKWIFDVRTYYYEDEIFEAKPYNLSDIAATIDRYLRLSDNEKIPFLLELEYGYLLDVVKNKSWSIKVVEKESINFGSQYRKTELIERYEDYGLPICVVIDTPDGLDIIDGYHRLLSTQKNKFPVIVGI